MNKDQVGGIIRALVTTAVGYAAGRGWLGGVDTAALITILTTAGVGVWSWVSNKV